ncbi:TNF receptor-associated factor 6-like [Haliotis rubra]|uniref:TNF receptor-associated factor 6-like n=1 Tax=Haliotis rubra TaxID=36100 RepID=UPI001EE504A5|nr:TNF receptor-associated factor 6-like [Haliotis rubra]XP_046573708.1 TNF receptor-associated factor 6-like [Haliotis rubra]XP_046573709.1 TNF receptor-associated factor 6-like [Haliotis rubra]XP_046573710.1 TNF receptor-associated factor 6-like [Haliotis rubra]
MDENEANLGQPSFPSGSDSASFGEGSSSGPAYWYQERTEGFDYDFVPTPDPKYECAICLLILREPRQTKCGHRFCRGCITKWLRECDVRCPVDNEPIDERELFADNFAKREILNFKVKCPNSRQGCEVLATLKKVQEHTDQCPLALVPCPNRCMDILLRRDVPNHVQFNCRRRILQCQNCQKDVAAEGMEHHLTECPLVQVVCQYCGGDFVKQALSGHHDKDCPTYPISCDFGPLGCSAQFDRKMEQEHYVDATVDHQRMLCHGVVTILHKFGIQSLSPASVPALSGGLTPMEMSTSLSAMGSYINQFQGLTMQDHSHVPNISGSRTPDGQSVKQFNLDSLKTSIDPRQLHRSMSDTLPQASNETVEGAHVSHTSKPSDAEGVHGALSLQGASGLELQSLKNQNMYQDESLARHDQQLVEIKAKNEMLEKANKELKYKLRYLDNAVQEFEGRACNGQFYWKIKNYHKLREEAEQGINTALHSPSFYSNCYGYKLCIRANLNGVDAAKGSHLSIFIHFMQGDWDEILDWPFSGRIVLSVIDQNPICELRNHIAETLIAKPNLAAFQKPVTPRNHKGFGYMEFVALSVLDNADFVRNDTLIIKAQIIPAT